jgi:Zn-dependent oligopeptidase
MPGSTSRVLLAIAFVLATFPPAPAHASDALDWHGTPSSIAADCDVQLTALRERTSAIAASRAPRSFGATVLQLENAVADANDALAAQRFLARVAPDKRVEDAAVTCQTALANERAALDADPSLYAAMLQAKRSHTARSVYDRKLTELWFTAMTRSGAALSPPRRTEFLNLTRELNDIGDRLEERFDAAPPLMVGHGEVAASAERHGFARP